MTADGKLTIQFNGTNTEVPLGTTVAGLLEIAKIRIEVVAVEVNQEIVSRDRLANTLVQDGDTIEAVTLVGGG